MKDSISEPLKKYAQVGIASKGLVYILAGGLTCAAALGFGRQSNSGKEESLSFVYSQPFGKLLLCIIAVGLLGYTVFKFFAGYEYNKSDKPFWFNWGKKIAYFGSGAIYASVAFSAVKMALGSSSGSGGGSKQSIIQELLGSTIGQIVLFVFACIIIGRACFQFYLAWTGKFTKRVQESKLDQKSQKMMEYTGIFGYTSRGVVILIIAYMFIKAVLNNNPSQADDGMSESFQLIDSNFGGLVLAIISLGLCSYGLFMLIKSYFCYMPEIE